MLVVASVGCGSALSGLYSSSTIVEDWNFQSPLLVGGWRNTWLAVQSAIKARGLSWQITTRRVSEHKDQWLYSWAWEEGNELSSFHLFTHLLQDIRTRELSRT